jgi:hypothetical protein
MHFSLPLTMFLAVFSIGCDGLQDDTGAAAQAARLQWNVDEDTGMLLSEDTGQVEAEGRTGELRSVSIEIGHDEQIPAPVRPAPCRPGLWRP